MDPIHLQILEAIGFFFLVYISIWLSSLAFSALPGVKNDMLKGELEIWTTSGEYKGSIKKRDNPNEYYLQLVRVTILAYGLLLFPFLLFLGGIFLGSYVIEQNFHTEISGLYLVLFSTILFLIITIIFGKRIEHGRTIEFTKKGIDLKSVYHGPSKTEPSISDSPFLRRKLFIDHNEIKSAQLKKSKKHPHYDLVIETKHGFYSKLIEHKEHIEEKLTRYNKKNK